MRRPSARTVSRQEKKGRLWMCAQYYIMRVNMRLPRARWWRPQAAKSRSNVVQRQSSRRPECQERERCLYCVFFWEAGEEVVAEIPSLPLQSGSIRHRQLDGRVLFGDWIQKKKKKITFDLTSANVLVSFVNQGSVHREENVFICFVSFLNFISSLRCSITAVLRSSHLGPLVGWVHHHWLQLIK